MSELWSEFGQRLLHLFSCVCWGGAVLIMFWTKMKKPSDAAIAILILGVFLYVNLDSFCGRARWYAVAQVHALYLRRTFFVSLVSSVAFFRSPMDPLGWPLLVAVLASQMGWPTMPALGVGFARPKTWKLFFFISASQLAGIISGFLFTVGCLVPTERAKLSVEEIGNFMTAAAVLAGGKLLRKFEIPSFLVFLVQTVSFMKFPTPVTAAALSALGGSRLTKIFLQERLSRKFVKEISMCLAVAVAIHFSVGTKPDERTQFNSHTLLFEFFFSAVLGVTSFSPSADFSAAVFFAAQRLFPSVTLLPEFAVSRALDFRLCVRLLAQASGLVFGQRAVAGQSFLSL